MRRFCSGVFVWGLLASSQGCGSGSPATSAPIVLPTPTVSPPSADPARAPAPAEPVEPAEPTEAVEAGPFLTPDDGPVPALRPASVAESRPVILPQSLARPGRDVAYAVRAIGGEHFLFIDAHRLAIIDGESGAVRATRVIDDHLAIEPSSVTVDRSGRVVGFVRNDGRHCVWDLDLDRVDCTEGNLGLVSTGGRDVFVSSLEEDGIVHLDLTTARRRLLPRRLHASLVLAAISPSERRLVLQQGARQRIVGRAGHTALVDAATGELVRDLPGEWTPGDPFRPQGGTWITHGREGLAFRDTLTGALRRREPLAFEPTRIYWSPDGASLVAYRFDHRGAHAVRFDATTGEPRGDIAMRAIPSEWHTPGFRADDTFDFFEENETPSATGRTALRIDDYGMTAREVGGTRRSSHVSSFEESPLLDVLVSESRGLGLVTPFGVVALSASGLEYVDEAHFGRLERELQEDLDPDAEGMWTSGDFSQAGLLSIGGGFFVERVHGIVYAPSESHLLRTEHGPIACGTTEVGTCCLAAGSHDERAGRGLVRTLDRVLVMSADGRTAEHTVSLERCGNEECAVGEQCEGGSCTAEVYDGDTYGCALRASEEPRLDAAGTTMIASHRDGTLESFEVASGRRIARIARARSDGHVVQAFDIRRDGSVVAFARGTALQLFGPSGVRVGEVEARLARPARFVRFLDEGGLLVGLVDDSLHWLDEATLVETRRLPRPGHRAETPSRLASVACREGSLRWIDHAEGADPAGRELGSCARDSRIVVSRDLRFVIEERGATLRVHRVTGSSVVTVTSGYSTRRFEDEGTPPLSQFWVLATDEAGMIERVGMPPITSFSRREGGVRSGTITPLSVTDPTGHVVSALFVAEPPVTPSPSSDAGPGDVPSPGTSSTPGLRDGDDVRSVVPR